MGSSIALSIREFFNLSPKIRYRVIASKKYWVHFFWGCVIFALISAIFGFVAALAWERLSYFQFLQEAIPGSLLFL